MLITRLYLRNYRVYEDELDLVLPPGLVGIYGANGSGKSTLLEAILFTLWGKSRTGRDQIRSSGVGGECVTEVEFEHEGHLYLVRRCLRGINSQMTVEAHCDGNVMSTGTRDAERFVESVLGMDDASFRASVFTEQKQLAAFSSFAPAERRRLVLQLLGITPLDAARDAARRDARQLGADHDRLRGMLPDLDRLRTDAADAAVAADAEAVRAADESRAADAARARHEQAAGAFAALDQLRQEHDTLVIEGRSARQEMDNAARLVSERSEELGQLDVMAAHLPELEAAAAGADDADILLSALERAREAAVKLDSATVAERPEGPDEETVTVAVAAAEELRHQLAICEAMAVAARSEADKAAGEAARSQELDAEGQCPTCGQPLGEAFATVQAHRRAEAELAAERATELSRQRRELMVRSREADAVAQRLGAQASAARSARAAWELAVRRREDAAAERDETWAAARSVGGAPVLDAEGWSGDGPPPAEALERAARTVRAERQRRREAAGQVLALRSRMADRPRIEASLVAAQERADAARSRVEILRDKVKAVAFDPIALTDAAARRDEAASAAEAARRGAQEAAVTAAGLAQAAAGAVARLDEGQAQHAKLAELETEARHRSRAAELLSEFRNTVVASVGPRLAVQAADLFNELTDHDYERIEVDGDTYQLQISDGGRLYGLERFSGSEIDLANLALRVAISEHIHFQSGGSVGLLVLDEVFGPLDEDRKARMLQALERLKGRFRQVLVVTHDTEIKEQLPNAIEVVKLPGRRATARIVGD